MDCKSLKEALLHFHAILLEGEMSPKSVVSSLNPTASFHPVFLVRVCFMSLFLEEMLVLHPPA